MIPIHSASFDHLVVRTLETGTLRMGHDISFTRFAHFDTNIISNICKDTNQWRPLQDFLHANDLCMGISGAQVAELSNAKHLHESLNTLLTALPSVLIKPAHQVLSEEVRSHPERRIDTLLSYPLNALLGSSDFGDFLSSGPLADARSEQRLTAPEWIKALDARKSNFPPTNSGKYTKAQADEFTWLLTLQELAVSHLEFLKLFQNDVSSLKAKVFLSQQIMGYVIFYKYYMANEAPKESDFGDMFHLYDIPYCKLAIVERNMCGFLNQVKRNHGVLDGVVVMNKDFLTDWKWNEEK